jgi:tetratricopeptide (TPR) repeat protein
VPIREAHKLADKYTQMAMKNPTALSYWLASKINLDSHRPDAAIADAERAIALSPNDPDCQVMMAEALIFAGRPNEAFGFVKRAMRLDPNYPASYERVLGLAHFAVGELQEAANLMERAVTRNPDLFRLILPLAASYAHLGNDQKAKATLKSAYGAMSTGNEWFYFPFKDPVVAKRLSEGLRKARAK